MIHKPLTLSYTFNEHEIERSIPARFEQVAAVLPAQLALIGNVSYTYDELNQAANRLAKHLDEQWHGIAEPVALLFDHDTSVIAAILGVLKAAKICAVLDPLAPPQRLQAILDDLGAALLLTNHHHLPCLLYTSRCV